MRLKRWNAVIALLAAVLLAVHNTINARMMLLGRVTESPAFPARALAALVVIHALVSLYLLIFRHEKGGRIYPKITAGFILQRVTGIAMILPVVFHAAVRAGSFGVGLIPVLWVHFAVMVLSYVHIPLSVPNALVTLGVLSTARAHRTARLVCAGLCAVLFALGLWASLSEVTAL